MLFNSPEFIFAFLPLTVAVFYLIPRLLGHGPRGTSTAKGWLLVASLFFYGYWDYRQLPILLGSMAVNYAVGRGIAASWGAEGRSGRARGFLVVGVVLNLAVLGYFKYAAFFAENLNAAFGLGLPVLHPVLPLGISFFTFQELAFLVDAYRERLTPDEYRRTFRPINFSLFIAFFPQITAGPIARRHEILPQMDRLLARRTDWDAMAVGAWSLIAGLFKKVVVAEAFAVWATRGFDEAPAVGFADAWLASLSYTFQVYFDFSGYSDIAIGCGSMLGIVVPINFNSPYQATSIQDFWRRWHISLSTFLRDYVYFPLGGGRRGTARAVFNTFATLLLCGLWHGASWGFVFWGFLHGVLLTIHRFWKRTGLRMPSALAWFLTLHAVNFTRVFFRARDTESAWKVLRGMMGLDGLGTPGDIGLWPFVALALGVASIFLPNSNRVRERFRPTPWMLLWGIAMAVAVVLSIVYLQVKSTFVYWQF